MSGNIEKRLQDLGIELPVPPAPAAAYVPYVVTGNLVFVAGQLPFVDGTIRYAGRVGENVSVLDAQLAARVCGLNIIAQVKAACGGDLDRVVRCVKLGGFVACVPEFVDHPKVVSGASEIIAEIFEEKGAHARFAVGAAALPLGAAVEVDAIFEIA